MRIEVVAIIDVDDSEDWEENETLEKEIRFLEEHINHPLGRTSLVKLDYKIIDGGN